MFFKMEITFQKVLYELVLLFNILSIFQTLFSVCGRTELNSTLPLYLPLNFGELRMKVLPTIECKVMEVFNVDEISSINSVSGYTIYEYTIENSMS